MAVSQASRVWGLRVFPQQLGSVYWTPQFPQTQPPWLLSKIHRRNQRARQPVGQRLIGCHSVAD